MLLSRRDVRLVSHTENLRHQGVRCPLCYQHGRCCSPKEVRLSVSKTLAGRSLLGFHHKGRRGSSSDVGGDSMATRPLPKTPTLALVLP